MGAIMARSFEVRLGSQGRLVIPAELRSALAAEEGTVYTAHIDESGALVLRSRAQALTELKRMWRGVYRTSAVEDLLSERRAAAAAAE
jgi:bifunctional DNA-binding transcriptional regulator/antitoxin component of YhaV-PrlF toxin-antitoxin module